MAPYCKLFLGATLIVACAGAASAQQVGDNDEKVAPVVPSTIR